ncbi:MAG: NAD-dependent epimerase/dehydratase family protein [Hyphomicrobiaceae bacterium]
MRVLVTGGGGFIAAWLIKQLLEEGVSVRSLDLSAQPQIAQSILGDDATRIDWRAGDIANAADVEMAVEDCDLIMHLAAILTPDCAAAPQRGCDIVLGGTLNVFEAARKRGHGHVLYMSSAGVYGPEQGHTPEPTTLYGAYKLAGEGAARAYLADHGMASAGFRPLVVYGPGRESGLTAGPSLACKAAANDSDFVIPFSGDSDFIYVDDIAASFVAAMKHPPQGAKVYNIVADRCATAEFAAEVTRQVPGTTISAQGPHLPIVADIDEGDLRVDYPEVPRTTIRDGIAKTIAFYRTQ